MEVFRSLCDKLTLAKYKQMRSSSTYTKFPTPIKNNTYNDGFDVHVYFHKDNENELTFVRAIRRAIKADFPELPVYDIRYQPVGPHPISMFQVNVGTPAEFGAFIPWLVVHHECLSVLVHPNTGDARRDHTDRAIWIGTKLPLKLDAFERDEQMDAVMRQLEFMISNGRDGDTKAP
ncbi:MAG: hypothetical protein Q9166_005100 [cf. Caloplaca sp. 2 TL-2023]